VSAEKDFPSAGNETPDSDGVVHVLLPDEPPVLYPQAARVLRRIVVHVARVRVGSDADDRSKGRAS
jgi:hypothetical protein